MYLYVLFCHVRLRFFFVVAFCRVCEWVNFAVCPFCSSVKTWPLLFAKHLRLKFHWVYSTLNGSIDKPNYADEIPFLPNLESCALFFYTGMRSKNQGFSSTLVSSCSLNSKRWSATRCEVSSFFFSHPRTHKHTPTPFPNSFTPVSSSLSQHSWHTLRQLYLEEAQTSEARKSPGSVFAGSLLRNCYVWQTNVRETEREKKRFQIVRKLLAGC